MLFALKEPFQQLLESTAVGGLLHGKVSVPIQCTRIFQTITPDDFFYDQTYLLYLLLTCSRPEHAWNIFHWVLSNQQLINQFKSVYVDLKKMHGTNKYFYVTTTPFSKHCIILCHLVKERESDRDGKFCRIKYFFCRSASCKQDLWNRFKM